MFQSFLLPSWFRWQQLLLMWMLLSIQLARAQAPTWQTAIASVLTGYQEGVTATASDACGNIYITGIFLDTITLGTTKLTSSGGTDIFVAKWSPATGSFLWAQRAGSMESDYINAISVSGTSIYLAGYFFGPTATFGSVTVSNAGPRITNTSDAFVAKLTDAGTSSSFIWAQAAGGAGLDAATALAVEGTSVYVTGEFIGPTARFGTITLTTATNTSTVFVAKLTDLGSSGSYSWAQQGGGSDDDKATAIAVQGKDVYVTGYFRSLTASFGTLLLSNTSALFAQDTFIVKLIDAGTSASFTWAQQVGGTSDEQANAIVVNGTNVYVAGYFKSATAHFGSTALTATTPYDSNAFVAKLMDGGTSGSFIWAQQDIHSTQVAANALAIDGANIYVAGSFVGPHITLGGTTLTSAGGQDAFVAKLTDAGRTGSFIWAQQAGGTGFDKATAVTITRGRLFVAGFISGSATFGSLSVVTGGTSGFLASLTVGATALPSVVQITRPHLPSLTCARDTTFRLQANVPGGTWAGAGITNAVTGTFYSAAAGPGRHVLTYSLALASPCGEQDTLSIVVHPIAVRVLTSTLTLCRLDTVLRLTATPAGGTWRGRGITNATQGLFAGIDAGPGSHMLRYELGSGTCRAADSVMVLINLVPRPVLNPQGPLTLRCGQSDELLSVANATMGSSAYEWQYTGNLGTSWQALISANGQLTYKAAQAGWYRVRASQGGCMAFSAPVELRVEAVQPVFVPTIFTPNADGINEVFELRLQAPRTFHLQVFNRWGREVFSTDTYGDFWTGAGASAGVYYYL